MTSAGKGDDMLISKEELLEKIESRYGEGSLTNELGGYVNGEWLSIKNIVDIIDECYEEDN